MTRKKTSIDAPTARPDPYELHLRDLYKARASIAPLARRTPLMHSEPLSSRSGARVYLKLETAQETGAFKIRGAANKLLHLRDAQKAAGVVTVSTGNHGRAVAHVARQLGVRATICITELVPPHKVDAMRALGAQIVVAGADQDAAERHAIHLAQSEGLTLISPFDDPHIIAGQGTIGLEILEDLPDCDTVIVPLSGGGLMAGIALALKSADPNVRVIGASMERGPAMYDSLQAGRPLPVVEEKTLADSLSGGIGLDNRYTFALCQRYVDDVVLLSEAEIADAMAFALHTHHLVVEGGGAVGMGALLSGKATELGRHVAVVVSGGNVDIPLLMRIAAERSPAG